MLTKLEMNIWSYRYIA